MYTWVLRLYIYIKRLDDIQQKTGQKIGLRTDTPRSHKAAHTYVSTMIFFSDRSIALTDEALPVLIFEFANMPCLCVKINESIDVAYKAMIITSWKLLKPTISRPRNISHLHAHLRIIAKWA